MSFRLTNLSNLRQTKSKFVGNHYYDDLTSLNRPESGIGRKLSGRSDKKEFRRIQEVGCYLARLTARSQKEKINCFVDRSEYFPLLECQDSLKQVGLYQQVEVHAERSRSVR